MIIWSAISWSLLAGGAAGPPAADSVLGPVFVAEPAEGPRLILYRQPEPPLVVIRLSVPVEEPAGWEGAARVLQELVRERARVEAASLGAEVELSRTASHAVYSIAGPAVLFDDMVALLRRAIGPPGPAPRGLDAARMSVQRREAAEWETPEPILRRRLQQALFPALSPSSSGAAALGTLTAERLRRFWRRHFVPERMTAVVVGPVEAVVALSAFRDWPATTEPAAVEPVGWVPAAPSDPDAIFAWAGLGYRADDLDPAVLALATAVIESRLSELGLRAARSELWWAGGERGLVVLGSTHPLSEAAASESGLAARGGSPPPLVQRLRTAVAEAAALATPVDVAEARRALRSRILFGARTPQGLAALLGELHERSGDPEAAQRFLAALERVDATAVRASLLLMLDRSPVVVEVNP